MDNPSPATGLQLNCRPGRESRTLIFEYALTNPGDRDVYVIDAMPRFDRTAKTVSANASAVSVVHAASGDAIVGKFLPPMPTSLRPAVPVTPLARRLPPGDTLSRRLEVREPLAECSPYLPDQLLRQYEMIDISAIAFTIGYYFAGDPGVSLVPTVYATDLFTVLQAGPAGMLVSQRFATRGLSIFRRTDAFPRALPG